MSETRSKTTVKFSKRTLGRGLVSVNRVSNSRSTLPILANIAITPQESSVEMTATDLEVGLRLSIDAEVVEGETPITLNGKKFHQFISLAPADDILVSWDDDVRCKIVSGNATWKLSGMSIDEFPAFPSPEKELFKITSQQLHRHLSATMRAAEKKATPNYWLRSIFVKSCGEGVHFVGNDGRRIHLSVESGVAIESDVEGIIPIDAATILLNTFPASENLIDVSIAEKQMFFSDDDTMFVARCFDGEYSKYRAVTDGVTPQVNIICPAEEIMRLLQCTIGVSGEDAARAVLTVKANSLNIESWVNPDWGHFSGDMPIQSDGEIQIGINPAFFLDAIKPIVGSVQIGFTDERGLITICGEGSKDEYAAYIAPMTIAK